MERPEKLVFKLKLTMVLLTQNANHQVEELHFLDHLVIMFCSKSISILDFSLRIHPSNFKKVSNYPVDSLELLTAQDVILLEIILIIFVIIIIMELHWQLRLQIPLINNQPEDTIQSWTFKPPQIHPEFLFLDMVLLMLLVMLKQPQL